MDLGAQRVKGLKATKLQENDDNQDKKTRIKIQCCNPKNQKIHLMI